MKGLTDIPGIRVGHVSDYEALTGCTVILFDQNAIAGVDIRGSASGTQELDVLSPLHITPYIHALCLAGGSAFGLEAASGVRRYLEQKGIGFQMSAGRVPIVPSIILYDLAIGKPDIRPTREMGEAAAAAANSGVVKEGNVGAGTGATVGKLFGITQAMKGGLGTFTVELPDGVLVSALAAVNSFGDILDPVTRKIIAGARTGPSTKELVNTAQAIKQRVPTPSGSNTLLGVVATNARLTKVEATKLAQVAHHGLARTVSPAHTIYDGDTVFAISSGSKSANITALSVAAAESMAEAIVRAVRLARGLGGVPAASDL